MRHFLGFLALAVVAVWLAVFSLPDDNLHLIACDVGEGDAVLVIYKNIQVLTDGGPGNKVLDCLARYIPFWDKEIEVVILTHPDKDHYAGLAEVFKRYQVDNYFTNGFDSGSQGYQALKKPVGSQQVLKTGTKIRVGKIQLDILHPPGEIGSQLAGEKAKEDNSNSIVSLLTFGGFKALLTGDMDSTVSDGLAAGRLAPSTGRGVNYLKVPHHGSKNGLTENLLKAIEPKVAVISVGKNSYGHPAEETLKMLRDYTTKVLRTDEMGDIEVISDGRNYWLAGD